MKNRCLNPNGREFKYYGGRGITVCELWLNDFSAFLRDMGPRPVNIDGSRYGMSVERLDNNKGYGPGNCVWAGVIQQANNRRNSIFLDFAGKRQTLPMWARELKIGQGTLLHRLRNGFPLDQVLTAVDFRKQQRPGSAPIGRKPSKKKENLT